MALGSCQLLSEIEERIVYRKLSFAWIVLCALFSTVSAQALTDDEVLRFIASFQEMRTVAEQYQDSDQLVPGPASSDEARQRVESPFTSSLADMRKTDGFSDMLRVMKKHGFASEKNWAAIGDRVIRAYAAVRMDEQAPQLNKEMAEALKQLEESTMPEAQKEMMREMMRTSNQFLEVYADVPEADKNAVRPHIAALEAVE